MLTRDFATAMRRALDQTRAGDPAAATRIIQDALNARPSAATVPAAGMLPEVEDAEVIAETAPRRSPRAWPAPRAAAADAPATPRRRLRDVIGALAKGRKGLDLRALRPGPATPRPEILPDIAPGARWERRDFASAHGSRAYHLYVPAALTDGPRGLVLMLHGCTQDGTDFAAGTAMNAQAERHGLIVVYPHQTRAQNPQACWNWFRPGDQRADAGEAAMLTALVRQVAAEFTVPADRVFAAGLSAGGAMAAILGQVAPQVFAAVGVHSGLPAGAASDVMGAFAAMRDGPASVSPPATRVIQFHGTADATVSAVNADRLLAAARRDGAPARRDSGHTGRAWQRTTVGPAHAPRAEDWRIEGLGHAWSGGSARGSYTDATGPDASAEMVRFFLAR